MWLVLRKKNILWRTLAKIVEKIKVTKLKYLITAWLHSNNPLQRKHARRKLVFTVAVLLKGNRSSFSKQLGINCTCEQIVLFLISTRGCGSHSWKLLKSPICSRVQLIPNCFSNRPISYTYWTVKLCRKKIHFICTLRAKKVVLVTPRVFSLQRSTARVFLWYLLGY